MLLLSRFPVADPVLRRSHIHRLQTHPIDSGGYKLRLGRLRIGQGHRGGPPPKLAAPKSPGRALPRNYGNRQRLSGSLWAP